MQYVWARLCYNILQGPWDKTVHFHNITTSDVKLTASYTYIKYYDYHSFFNNDAAVLIWLFHMYVHSVWIHYSVSIRKLAKKMHFIISKRWIVWSSFVNVKQIILIRNGYVLSSFIIANYFIYGIVERCPNLIYKNLQ